MSLVPDLAGVAIGVPDAGAAAAFLRRAFDLETGGRDTPHKIAVQIGKHRQAVVGLRVNPLGENGRHGVLDLVAGSTNSPARRDKLLKLYQQF